MGGFGVLVEAGEAGGDVGEDVVGDGVGCAGEVGGGLAAGFVLADDGDLVGLAGLGDVGEVDHAAVHADGADDGGGAVMDEDACAGGEAAGEAGGVAGADDADSGVALGGPGAAVGDGAAGGDFADGEDGGAPCGGRAQGGLEGVECGLGGDAVEGEAGADHVERGLGEAEEGGGVGGVEDVGVDAACGFEEAGEGFEGDFGVAGGAGEVGVDAVERDFGAGADGGGEGEGAFGLEAVVAHAGVDVDVGAGGALEAGGGAAEGVDGGAVGDCDGEVESDGASGVVRRDRAEDDDVVGEALFAQLLGFVYVEDADGGSAGLHGGAGDLQGPVAVGVGLDDGGEFGGAGEEAQLAHVVADCGEVDLDPGAGRRALGSAEGFNGGFAVRMRLRGRGRRAIRSVEGEGLRGIGERARMSERWGWSWCRERVAGAFALHRPLREPESHGLGSAPPPYVPDVSNALRVPRRKAMKRLPAVALACAAVVAGACGGSAEEPQQADAPAEAGGAAATTARGTAGLTPRGDDDGELVSTRASSDPLRVVLTEADALQVNGFWEAALELRERAINDPGFASLSAPEQYGARLDQVQVLLKLERGADADGLITELAWDLTTMPADSARRHALLSAASARLRGDPEAELAAFDRYVGADGPSAASIQLQRARLLIELERFADANLAADQALSYAALPAAERLEALLLSARALEALGQPDAAIAQYRALLEASPSASDQAVALARIGGLSWDAGDRASAIGAWGRLAAEHPGREEAEVALDALTGAGERPDRLTTGILLMERDYLVDARSTLIEVLVGGTAGEKAAAEFYVARIAQLRDDVDGAVAGYLAVPSRDAASEFAPEGLWRAADLLSEIGSSASAEPVYARIMRDYPSSGRSADAALRFALWRADEVGWEEAAARLEEGLSVAGRHWTINERQRHQLWQGIAASHLGREIEAVEFWRAAASLGAGRYYGVRAAALAGADSVAASAEQTAEEWLTSVAGRDPGGGASAAGSVRWRSARELRRGALDGAAVDQLAAWRRDAGGDAWALLRMAQHLASAGEPSAALAAAGQLLGVVGREWWEAPAEVARFLFPDAWGDLRAQAADDFGVDPLLFASLMRWESSFDPNARGAAGEIGLSQVIPTTSAMIAAALGEEHEHERLARPETAIRYGAWFLGSQLEANEGRPIVALAAYNAGPGNAARWLEVASGFAGPSGDQRFADDAFEAAMDYPGTRAYVRKILETREAYRALASVEAGGAGE